MDESIDEKIIQIDSNMLDWRNICLPKDNYLLGLTVNLATAVPHQ